MPDACRLPAVAGIFLLQRGLRQPQGIFSQMILQVHHGVHLFNIGIIRGRKLQKGVPLFPVARIALPQIPCAGITVLADFFIRKRQRRKALLGSGAGSCVGLFRLLRRFAHIALKGPCLCFDGILRSITCGVILHKGVEQGHGPLPRTGGNTDGDQRHQQDRRQPARDLCPQRYPAALILPAHLPLPPLLCGFYQYSDFAAKVQPPLYGLPMQKCTVSFLILR